MSSHLTVLQTIDVYSRYGEWAAVVISVRPRAVPMFFDHYCKIEIGPSSRIQCISSGINICCKHQKLIVNLGQYTTLFL